MTINPRHWIQWLVQIGNKAYNQYTTRVSGLSGRTRPLHFDLTIVLGVLGRYKRLEVP
jgi:hypothetical protein